MEDQTLKEISALLAEMPPGSANKWSPATTKLYGAALADIPDDLVLQAVGHALRTEDFRPSPARIREIAKQIAQPISADPGNALAEVRRAIARYGLNGRPTANPNIFLPGEPKEIENNPHLACAVQSLGGWESVNEYPREMFTAHFQQVYKSIVAGASDDEINTLRIEYREQKQLEMDRVIDEEGEPFPAEPRTLAEPQEAKRVLDRVGAGVKGF